MFEQSASEIPSSSIWASMNSWFTPSVFFVLLNVMIGTIAFTSTLANKKQHQNEQPNETHHHHPKNSTSQETQDSSTHQKPNQDSNTLFQNLAITQSHYFFPQETNPQISQSQEETHKQNPQEYSFNQEIVHQTLKSQAHYIFEQTHQQSTQETQTHFNLDQKDSILDGFKQNPVEKNQENEAKSMDEVYTHFMRTKSDTKPASGEIPVKLPARMKKSASLKSAFGHFEEEKIVEAAVTVRSNAKVTDGDEEVDAKADDFINKFKQQLKLQRVDSIVRYKEMIGGR